MPEQELLMSKTTAKLKKDITLLAVFAAVAAIVYFLNYYGVFASKPSGAYLSGDGIHYINVSNRTMEFGSLVARGTLRTARIVRVDGNRLLVGHPYYDSGAPVYDKNRNEIKYDGRVYSHVGERINIVPK